MVRCIASPGPHSYRLTRARVALANALIKRRLHRPIRGHVTSTGIIGRGCACVKYRAGQSGKARRIIRRVDFDRQHQARDNESTAPQTVMTRTASEWLRIRLLPMNGTAVTPLFHPREVTHGMQLCACSHAPITASIRRDGRPRFSPSRFVHPRYSCAFPGRPMDQRWNARPIGGRCDIGAYDASLLGVHLPLIRTQ